MTNPLLRDISSQALQLWRLGLKLCLLLALFWGLDRLIGGFLRAGLDRYYGLNEAAVVLCVGHSHTVLGIDKVYLEEVLGIPVAKFAVEGANTSDRLMMIRYYFRRQPHSVRAVVYDVDAHSFTGAGLSSSSYQLLFPFIDDPEIRTYIGQNCASRSEFWVRLWLCTPRYNELTISLAARGFLKDWSNLKFGKLDVERIANQIRQGRFRRIEFDRDNLEAFNRTVDFVSSQRCCLFLAYIPTIDVLNHAEPGKFQRAVEIFSAYAATNSSVLFLDYNALYEHRHDLFFDQVHLNRAGQNEVSGRLVEDLKRFLEQTPVAGVSNGANPAAAQAH